MENIERYRNTIERILDQYTQIPYAYGDTHTEAVFDRINDRYLLVNVGWDRGRRVHGSLAHIDIIDDKIWIQRDGTEDGIANELVSAGIPRDRIVLGFRPAEVRPFIEFAVA